MSLWAEHPYRKFFDARKQACEALNRLAGGSSEEPPSHYIIRIINSISPLTDIVLDFPVARLAYFPDAGNPTHVLVWTPSSSHSFDYHDISSITKL